MYNRALKYYYFAFKIPNFTTNLTNNYLRRCQKVRNKSALINNPPNEVIF